MLPRSPPCSPRFSRLCLLQLEGAELGGDLLGALAQLRDELRPPFTKPSRIPGMACASAFSFMPQAYCYEKAPCSSAGFLFALRSDLAGCDRVAEAQSGAALKLAKPIRALGCILLIVGSAFILGGQIQVYRKHGFNEFQQITSWGNLPYYCAAGAVLLPGATLIALGQWLVARRRRRRRLHSYLLRR